MKSFMILFGVIIIITHSICDLTSFEECFAESAIANDNKPVVNINDPKLKCFNACLMKKSGVLKNGKIDPNKQFQISKRSSYENLNSLKDKVNACSLKANKLIDDCEVANTMKECMADNFGK